MSAESQFNVVCWNVGQANREEQFEKTKWDARSPGVKALLRKCNPDIMCLLELRDLKTSHETIGQFLASFSDKYDHAYRRYGRKTDSFGAAVLVDKSKMAIDDVRVHHFHERSGEWNRMVMFVDITQHDTAAGLCRFTVGVTHFSMEEEVKWTETVQLANLINQQKLPVFVYGDNNFFDNRDGKAQRTSLMHLVPRCRDLVHPLLDPRGITLSGTFLGFAHDEFKCDIHAMGRLDHVFASDSDRLSLVGPATSQHLCEYYLDNSCHAGYTYPSDHLLLQFRVAIKA